VRQAVAVSQFVFPAGKAKHAVLARRDDFADALAGSSLGFGAGPLLFTGRTGPLDPVTAAELTRVLPPGTRVYLLGGTSALPAALEGELVALGFDPIRLAGPTRQATAAAVATEVMSRVQELGFDAPRGVILATARDWPDAVTAGSLGAWFGYPILLTDPTSLTPVTSTALAALRPARLYVVGGTSAVSSAVAVAAQAAAQAATAIRLAGADRDATAVVVAQRFADELRPQSRGADPALAIAVNLRRTDGFANVLSATAAVGAYSGVFLPVEGNTGDTIPVSAAPFACSLDPRRAIIVGATDVVSDVAEQRLNDLLEHTAKECL
jgi:putative cell wall-binding protein